MINVFVNKGILRLKI